MIKISVVALCVVTGLSGCGSSSIDPSASEELQVQVAAIRDAAAAGDDTTAQEGLGELVERVHDLRSSGEIDEEKAREILSAVGDVDSALAAIAEEEAILNEEDDDLGDEGEDEEDDEDTKKSKTEKPTKGHSKDD